MANGFENLKTSFSKRFAKTINEQVIAYYREKKNNIKKKQKKLITGKTEHIRLNMKAAFHSLIIRNDYKKSIERLNSSYLQLKNTSVGQSFRALEEKRDNADILAFSILNMLILSEQLEKFIEFYRMHFSQF